MINKLITISYLPFMLMITSCAPNVLDASNTEHIDSAKISHDKPNIWVYSDLSDPRDRRQGGHPQNDPDDISAMGSLLLSAHRYNIAAIVVGSNHRINLKNPMPFVNEVILSAYEHDVKNLQKIEPSFPDTIKFHRSSLSQQNGKQRFKPHNNYSDLTDYPTVQALVNYAKDHPVKVLSWGPITEPAIAIKHLLDKGDIATLNNIEVYSHWTKSSISQGSIETPFKVANCTDDKQACDYMHNIAATNKNVKFIELGSVGQSGLVNGSQSFKHFAQFDNSRLGQVFVRSKFYYNAPDQSDAATHWLLNDDLGLNINNYTTNGALTNANEQINIDNFYKAAPIIMEKLHEKSQQAASTPYTDEFLSEYFTYVYIKNGHYEVYAPYNNMKYNVYNTEKKLIQTGTFKRGNQKLTLPIEKEGYYKVIVMLNEWQKEFSL